MQSQSHTQRPAEALIVYTTLGIPHTPHTHPCSLVSRFMPSHSFSTTSHKTLSSRNVIFKYLNGSLTQKEGLSENRFCRCGVLFIHFTGNSTPVYVSSFLQLKTFKLNCGPQTLCLVQNGTKDVNMPNSFPVIAALMSILQFFQHKFCQISIDFLYVSLFNEGVMK